MVAHLLHGCYRGRKDESLGCRAAWTNAYDAVSKAKADDTTSCMRTMTHNPTQCTQGKGSDGKAPEHQGVDEILALARFSEWSTQNIRNPGS